MLIRKVAKWWRALSGWHIIAYCLLIGLVVGSIISWRESLPDQKLIPPAILPALPVPAVAVESLSSLGFFDPDIRVQVANGATYMLQWQEDGRQWSSENLHDTKNDGESCSVEILSLMQDEAGVIVDCQTAHIVGEWCAGPIVSVAVTETGEVWEMAENEPCGFVFKTSLFLIEILSLLVGLYLASFKLITKWFPMDTD
ncbi:hypothetical protein [Candidatus Leptofilum sp.]|uniref:hypothetical protein n=1 Tax=Candidatus Leptofilum sp. TaxID=3241576 RepID=UPI003B5CD45D